MDNIKNLDRTITGDRSVRHLWRTPSTDNTGDYDDGLWEGYAELFVYHDKERKQFVASLNPKHFNGNVYKFDLMSGVTVARQPVARYSAKGLGEFAAHALGVIDRLAHKEPTINKILADAVKERAAV